MFNDNLILCQILCCGQLHCYHHGLIVTELNIGVTYNHGYVPFVIVTIQSFYAHWWLINVLLTWIRRGLLLVQQWHPLFTDGFELSIFIFLCSFFSTINCLFVSISWRIQIQCIFLDNVGILYMYCLDI